ncbi:hypothetical protein [Corynebacterium xerosis]|nr:hypothetical protein [Corynebacterium xerosis]
MPLINEPYDYPHDRPSRRPEGPEVGCLPYLYVLLVLIVVIVVAGVL